MTLREYLVASREPRYSIAMAVPLLILYEGLAAVMTRSSYEGVRNGADVLLKTIFVTLGGPAGVGIFGLLLAGFGAWLIVSDIRRRGRLITKVFPLMLVESLIYAALLGSVVNALTSLLLNPTLATYQGGVVQIGLGTQLVVSLGAGLYEELLFRVLLVTGITAACTRLGLRRTPAVAVAVLGSALIFSGFHYVGPLGDPLTLPSFTFRAVAGLLLSGLYVARGFGITAWAHALYDVALSILIAA